MYFLIYRTEKKKKNVPMFHRVTERSLQQKGELISPFKHPTSKILFHCRILSR
jgi:hypothetical protein